MYKFIVTDELGRLATWLRILGFDTSLEKNKQDIVIKSLREDRAILTRDSKMSRFTGMRMIKIESDFVEEQVAQIIKELNLKIDKGVLFTRCILCNKILEKAEKESVEKEVPLYVFQTQKLFMRCPKCKKVYWQGTHWAKVGEFVDRLGLSAK
jgi:hypothetical protein